MAQHDKCGRLAPAPLHLLLESSGVLGGLRVFKIYIFIEVYLIYNIVLVSGV